MSPLKKSSKPRRDVTLYPHVVSRNGYIGLWDAEKEKFHPAATEIRLKRVINEIETDTISWELAFDYKGKERLVRLAREEVTRLKIVQLAKYGADVFDNNANIVLMHLRNEEPLAPVVNVHSTIGWSLVDERLVYFAAKAIGLESEYDGQLEISPKGSFGGWKQLISEHVLGSTPLEAMLVFGLSAIVIGMIAQDTAIDTQIVHVYGDSSSGKTTGAMLSVSPYGYPALKRDGLFGTWHTTKNASVARLRSNNGMAVVLDELSMTDQSDLSSLLYSIASGKDKVRMQKDSVIRPTAEWNTMLISTGEHSMKVKSNQNTGLQVRKFEYGNVAWTASAEQSNALREGLLQHYGYAAPIMAKHMLKVGKQPIIDGWKDWTLHVLEQMKVQDAFSHRVAEKIAVAMVTADIAEQALSLEFNTDEILQFILEHEQGSKSERDLAAKAYDHFIEQVNINHHKFGKRDNFSSANEIPIYEQWGWMETNSLGRGKSETKIVVFKAKFRDMMSSGDFQDPEIVLKKWKERGLLDAEKDRLTRSRKISQADINVYVVRVVRGPADTNIGKHTLKLVPFDQM